MLICFQPYHRPTLLRTCRIRLSMSPGSVFQSCVVPYSIFAIIKGGAGSAFGSLRRSGTAGKGRGGMPSADVCRSGFLRGGGRAVEEETPAIDAVHGLAPSRPGEPGGVSPRSASPAVVRSLRGLTP